MRMRRALVFLVLALCAAGGVAASALGGTRAQAQTAVTQDPSRVSTTAPPTTDKGGVQHLHYEYGPLDIRPGQNIIQNSNYRTPHPQEDGWVVGFKPTLKLANGKVPPVDVLHLHHGVGGVAPRLDQTAFP